MQLVLVMMSAVCALGAALPVDQDNNLLPNRHEVDLLDKLNTRCSKRETSACLMLKLVAYVNRLLKKADISVTDSLEITQTSVIDEEKSITWLPSGRETTTDEEAVGDLIAARMWDFVRSRALRWKVSPGSEIVLSTQPDKDGQLSVDLTLRESPKETGRGKSKNMGPLILAGAMKIGMIGVLAFKALALLVGKALLVSKLAFLLAAIIGLKKLFSQQKHVTYEVVAHPHHSHGHSEGHDSYSSGWGRSLAAGDPHHLAYRAHSPIESGLGLAS